MSTESLVITTQLQNRVKFPEQIIFDQTEGEKTMLLENPKAYLTKVMNHFMKEALSFFRYLFDFVILICIIVSEGSQHRLLITTLWALGMTEVRLYVGTIRSQNKNTLGQERGK